MQNQMTKKLVKLILTICLLFSSLYLPAYAETANKAQNASNSVTIKKTPEANFLEGDTCLKQGNLNCARLALANIPGTSSYAKLLAGCIALNDQQIDKALSLLLPLQAEDALIPPARISLHQSLAQAFENLDDTLQAIQHLIEAETALISGKIKDSQASLVSMHDRIWAMLSKLEQSELVTLRGSNTDTVFQGWIDLRLAATNQDMGSSLNTWSMLYPDHPAQTFAKTISSNSHAAPKLAINLNAAGSIALVMPMGSEINAARAHAFRLGLEAALNRYDLKNIVNTYPSADNPQDIEATYTLAKQEGNAYFIQASFKSENADNRIENTGSESVLHLSPLFADEVQHIADFAYLRGMQKIAIITSENAIFAEMAANFAALWHSKTGDNSAFIIKLPADISTSDRRLLELKSELAKNMHDMILLALPATSAHLVRPHLQISTPTMTFSAANEISDQDTAISALNAVRLYDIPYLLLTDKTPYKDYEILDTAINTNALLRWFALGADSLQLLVAGQQLPDREVTINGLTGKLTVDNTGTIKRMLPLGRFTYNGIVLEP